jgi:hypothetical protein
LDKYSKGKKRTRIDSITLKIYTIITHAYLEVLVYVIIPYNLSRFSKLYRKIYYSFQLIKNQKYLKIKLKIHVN